MQRSDKILVLKKGKKATGDSSQNGIMFSHFYVEYDSYGV